MTGSKAGVYAAAATLTIAAGLAIAGSAGAREAADETITANDGLTFTPSQVNIDVNDSVTWTFANPVTPHNVVAKPDSPTPWSTGDAVLETNHDPVGPIPFTQAGTYTFYCQAHAGMEGTVIVGDGGTPPPDPDPDPDPSPSPSPSPQPSDPHTTTPAPTGGVADGVKPAVARVKLKALRRAVRVRFRLSEAATVTVRVKRRRAVLRTARVQARAGTRSVTLRSARLTKGRYTVEIEARDAAGNRSSLARKRLALRR
jgi:plastocyanin